MAQKYNSVQNLADARGIQTLRIVDRDGVLIATGAVCGSRWPAPQWRLAMTKVQRGQYVIEGRTLVVRLVK